MSSRVHIVGLDIVRFLAAYLVVFDHFSSFGWAFPTATATGDAAAFPGLHSLGNIGPVGVEIFFLLSGFVIVASVKGVTAGQFIASRAIRVFPALWICGVIAVLARAGAGEPLSTLLKCFFRSATLSPLGPYIDGVVWTLIVEAVFYVLIFLVILSDGRMKIEIVAKVLGCLSSLFIGILLLSEIAARVNPHLTPLAALCGRFPFKVLLLRHGVFFALGMGVWATFEFGLNAERLRWLCLFFVFGTVEVAIDRGGIGNIIPVVLVWWLGAGAMVLSIGYAEPMYHRLGRARRFIADMGRFSYPLYLNHYTLGQVIVPTLVGHGLTRSHVLVCSVLAVSVTSYIVMRWPERYLQVALRSRLPLFLVPRGRRGEPYDVSHVVLPEAAERMRRIGVARTTEGQVTL